MADFPRAAYPTGDEFITTLNIAKVTLGARGQALLEGWADSYVQSAIDAWEQQTGFLPFLAETEDSTTFYTPQGPEGRHSGSSSGSRHGGGRVLEFRGGYTSVTSVTVGMTPHPLTGDMQGGTSLVKRVGYRLLPDDAPQRKRPYEWLEFTSRQYGCADSIQIVGKQGFQAALQEHIYRAIVCGALVAAEGEIRSHLASGLLSWTEAGVSEKYRDDPLGESFAAWNKKHGQVLSDCTRESLNF